MGRHTEKDISEKVLGVKRKIGPAAERASAERKADGDVLVAPFANDANCDAESKPMADKTRKGLRASDFLIGAVLAPSAVKIAKDVTRERPRRDVPRSERDVTDQRVSAISFSPTGSCCPTDREQASMRPVGAFHQIPSKPVRPCGPVWTVPACAAQPRDLRRSECRRRPRLPARAHARSRSPAE